MPETIKMNLPTVSACDTLLQHVSFYRNYRRQESHRTSALHSNHFQKSSNTKYVEGGHSPKGEKLKIKSY